MALRIDLNGVALRTASGRVLCLFRFRTTEGILVQLPESVDALIPWAAVEEAALDLRSGNVRLRLSRNASRPAWLGEADALTGKWTDREILTVAPARI